MSEACLSARTGSGSPAADLEQSRRIVGSLVRSSCGMHGHGKGRLKQHRPHRPDECAHRGSMVMAGLEWGFQSNTQEADWRHGSGQSLQPHLRASILLSRLPTDGLLAVNKRRRSQIPIRYAECPKKGPLDDRLRPREHLLCRNFEPYLGHGKFDTKSGSCSNCHIQLWSERSAGRAASGHQRALRTWSVPIDTTYCSRQRVFKTAEE